MQSGKRRLHGGFTLIELLTVVAIIAIAAAIAVPAMRVSNVYALDRAATELAQMLRYARSEARRTGITHGVFAGTDVASLYQWDASIDYTAVRHPITGAPGDGWGLVFATADRPASLSGVNIVFDRTLYWYANYLNFAGGSGWPGSYHDANRATLVQAAYVLSYEDETRTVSVLADGSVRVE